MRISQIEKIQNLPLFLEKDHDRMPSILTTAVKSLIIKYQSKTDYDSKSFDEDLTNTLLQVECYAKKSEQLINNFQSLSQISQMIRNINMHVWMLFNFLRQQLDKVKQLVRPQLLKQSNSSICERCQKMITSEKVKRTKNELINFPFFDPYQYYEELQYTNTHLSKQFKNGVLHMINQIGQHQVIYPIIDIDKFNQKIFQLQSDFQRQSSIMKKCMQQLNQSQQKLMNSNLFEQKNIDYKQQIEIHKQMENQFMNIITKIYNNVSELLKKKRQSLWRDQQVQVNFTSQSYLKDIDKLKKKHIFDIKNLQFEKNNLQAQIQAKKLVISIKQQNILEVQCQNTQIKNKLQELIKQNDYYKNQFSKRSPNKKNSVLRNSQRRNTKKNTIKLDKNFQNESQTLKKIDEIQEIPIQDIEKILKEKNKKKYVQIKKNEKRSSILVHKQTRLSGLVTKPQSTNKIQSFQQKATQKSISDNQQLQQKSSDLSQNKQQKQISNPKIEKLNTEMATNETQLTHLVRIERKTTGSYFKKNAEEMNRKERKSLNTLNSKDQNNWKTNQNITQQFQQVEQIHSIQKKQPNEEKKLKIQEALKVIHQEFINNNQQNTINFDDFKKTVDGFLNLLEKNNNLQIIKTSKQKRQQGNSMIKKLKKTVHKINHNRQKLPTKYSVKLQHQGKSIFNKNENSQERFLPILIDTTNSSNVKQNDTKQPQINHKFQNHTWSIYSSKQKPSNCDNNSTQSKFGQKDIKNIFLNLENAYQFQSSFQKIKKINIQNNQFLKPYEIKYANQILALIANFHIYNKYIYMEIRNFLIQPYGYIINQQPTIQILKSQQNQLLLRQSIIYIILLHRKCTNKNKLCASNGYSENQNSNGEVCSHLIEFFDRLSLLL